MINNSRVSGSAVRTNNFPKTVNIELTDKKPKLSFLKKYSDAATNRPQTSVKNQTGRVAMSKLKMDAKQHPKL
jgi:hypothetical protein